MAEVDTSSYLKPQAPAPKSMLDTAQQLGQMEQQKVNVDASKLKLLNERFGIMNAELSTMANDPNITRDQVLGRIDHLAKLGFFPPDIVQKFASEVPNDQKMVKGYLETTLKRGMTVQEKLNQLYGVPGTVDDGQTSTPVGVSQMQGVRRTGPGIQRQEPPDTIVVKDGQSRRLGPQPYQTPSGTGSNPLPVAPHAVPGTPPVMQPGPINDPRIQGPSANFGGQVLGAAVEPPAGFNDRFGAAYEPRGSIASTPPLFEEGKKQFVEDQNLATSRMQSAKPALQALAMMEGLRTGPGTETWNKAVAFMKANGILNIENDKDPTAVYQEVNKKLNQYVAGSGLAQRSDAAQILAQQSNPNVQSQINPALIKLTRDAVILDRVEAARANAFEGKDFSKYGNHRSTFPQSVDERAFGLDLMPAKERQALIADMKKKQNTAEGKRFKRSLEIADKQGFYAID